MKQIDKNSVKAENQLKDGNYVTYINPDGDGIRILFLGNSITKHGYNKEIGWPYEFGMAASCIENDYVHLIIKDISKYDEDAVFCICQVSNWERQFKDSKKIYSDFVDAKKFNADIIIARMIENCPRDNFNNDKFKKEYADFITYFNNRNTKNVIVTSSFWEHDGDESLKEYAKENDYPFVYLGDLGEDDSMKAIGRFKHEGVAQHPGDKGMRKIADRIMAEIKKII